MKHILCTHRTKNVFKIKKYYQQRCAGVNGTENNVISWSGDYETGWQWIKFKCLSAGWNASECEKEVKTAAMESTYSAAAPTIGTFEYTLCK